MPRDEIIEAIANYFRIDENINSYDWQSGCTILGNDGEYRWLTLANILDAIDDYLDDTDD